MDKIKKYKAIPIGHENFKAASKRSIFLFIVVTLLGLTSFVFQNIDNLDFSQITVVFMAYGNP